MKNQKFFLIPLFLLLILGNSYTNGAGSVTPTPDQNTRLAALCKVWGLLKYYHPEVATGNIDWDQVLVSAIPAVKAAEDFDSFNQEIDNLILQAGDVVKSEYNPQTPAQPLNGLFKWIDDPSVFSGKVMDKLTLLQMKHDGAPNYYVQAVPYIGNTLYPNENSYSSPSYPDENYRLLALYRYWNIIYYFFPYRDVMDQDWEEVLDEFVPRMMEASNELQYHLVIKALTARINDAHAFTGSTVLSDFFGNNYAPFEFKYIEGKTVVTRVYHNLLDSPGDIEKGDVVIKRNGQDINDFRSTIRQYTHGSNPASLERNICRYVQTSSLARMDYTILRNGQTKEVSVNTYYGSVILEEMEQQDSQVPHWKILDGNIGYVHMGLLERPEADTAMQELLGTKAIIFDIRNYPQGTWWYITKYLAPTSQLFVKFSSPDLEKPGDFIYKKKYWAGPYPNNPDYFKGKVILLVNEDTQSHAEYTAMALQIAQHTTIIGSQTAGADGNVSYFFLPGGIYTYFSGIGVYYPNGEETQRVGIVPDIYLRPTLPGIRSGTDEVLNRAITFIETNK